MRWNLLGLAALALVGALLVAIGIYQIPAVDIPWHLVTGRQILEHRTFPTSNTFSWTFPAHRLDQQYPLFQVPLALVVDCLGWYWVTVVNALAWAFGVACWMRWGGTLKEATEQPLLWLLVVAAVQRHHVPRPEVMSLIGLGLMLIFLDQWRRGSRTALLGVIGSQWVMVNSHQLWPLGIVVQASFVIHLAWTRQFGGRWGFDATDREVPLLPTLGALAVSAAILMISPLGPRVYLAPLTTLGTLLSHGQATTGGAQARELAPVWSDPYSAILAALVLGTALFWIVRARRSIVPFELAILGIGLVMVLAAIRGMPFAAVTAGAVASRARARAGPLLPAGSPVSAAAALTTVALGTLFGRLIFGGEPALDRVQRGFGRTPDGWGDSATAFLRESPPPGELMNLGWAAGNPLIYGLYPVKRVFVDPRWEAYPREFLLETIAATNDRRLFLTSLEKWKPGFLVVELRLPKAVSRACELGDTWPLVYADTELAVFVHRTAASASYLTNHPPVDPTNLEPADGWRPEPVVRAQQQLRFGHLLGCLGNSQRSQWMLQEATKRADDPSVTAELASQAEPTAGPDPAISP